MSFWENYKKELKKEWGSGEKTREEKDKIIKEKSSPWTQKLNRDQVFLGIVGFGIIVFIAYNFNLPSALGAGILYYFLTRIITK